jgi:hypothetical protein
LSLLDYFEDLTAVHTNRQDVRAPKREDGEHFDCDSSAPPPSLRKRRALTGPLEEHTTFKPRKKEEVYGLLCQFRRLQSEAPTTPHRLRRAASDW